MKTDENSHFAVLLNHGEVIDIKNTFLKKEQNYSVFSNSSLVAYIDLESRRDSSYFIENYGQSLRSMSSGERKLSFFKYLITLEPKFLIVENFYEHLDSENRLLLEASILLVSKKIKIIQFVRKETELFPFINDFYTVSRNSNLVAYTSSISAFFKKQRSFLSDVNIPNTTIEYLECYSEFVSLKNVNVSFFDKPILKNISWDVQLGEFWQLIGENGAGKTTLLSLITGDSHKAYGQNIVLFDKLKGTEENVWEIKKKMGYFTSNITELFDKRHSALNMVLSGFYDSVGLYVKPQSLHIHIAKEWLELLGLTKKANKTFGTLSLSEQRLVLIARAMVKHPPLLILDEPTSGLNKENTDLIVSLINKISKETDTAIIYVSHIIEKGLFPDKTFKLNTSQDGSTGIVL